jgi:hypothetical protein
MADMISPTVAAIMAGGSVIGGIGGGMAGDDSDAAREAQMMAMQKWLMEQAQTKADKQAMLAYLNENMPEWEGVKDYQFDPSKFEDVLSPMRAMNEKKLLGTRNLAALQGRGRGGQVLSGYGRQARGQGQDYWNKLVGLRRGDEQEAYKRALQDYMNKYQAATQKAALVTGDLPKLTKANEHGETIYDSTTRLSKAQSIPGAMASGIKSWFK